MVPTSKSRPPIETIVETAIYATDLAVAEAFYSEVLGLPVVGREAGRHVFFQVGPGSMLLVFNPETTRRGGEFTPHGATGPGHFALGISRESLDDWRQQLIANDVVIEKEFTWPRGGHSIYFRDPAGNLVELITPGVWGTPAGW